MDYLFLIIGLVMLAFFGDALVRGAVGLASKLGLSPLIIGLTVVAFGTSAPELFVSIEAALDGAAGIAVGNVVGSNIANILLVMGVPALIAASGTPPKGLWINLAIMGFASINLFALAANGKIGISGAIGFLVILAAFLLYQIQSARMCRSGEIEVDELEEAPTKWLPILGWLIAGFIGLQIGANLVVDSSTDIARQWGVSDVVIGVTIVAIGTSLPELSAAVMAAINKRSELAIGNIIGSNIFNIALILGVTGLIRHVPIDPHIMKLDIWVMLGSAALLMLIYAFKLNLRFFWGLFLSLSYAAYLCATVAIS